MKNEAKLWLHSSKVKKRQRKKTVGKLNTHKCRQWDTCSIILDKELKSISARFMLTSMPANKLHGNIKIFGIIAAGSVNWKQRRREQCTHGARRLECWNSNIIEWNAKSTHSRITNEALCAGWRVHSPTSSRRWAVCAVQEIQINKYKLLCREKEREKEIRDAKS
jgi:hypothetical protein